MLWPLLRSSGCWSRCLSISIPSPPRTSPQWVQGRTLSSWTGVFEFLRDSLPIVCAESLTLLVVIAVYTRLFFSGSKVAILAYWRYTLVGIRPCGLVIHAQNDTRQLLFLWVYYVFLKQRSARAARGKVSLWTILAWKVYSLIKVRAWHLVMHA